jgi:hypothetical protein
MSKFYFFITPLFLIGFTPIEASTPPSAAKNETPYVSQTENHAIAAKLIASAREKIRKGDFKGAELDIVSTMVLFPLGNDVKYTAVCLFNEIKIFPIALLQNTIKKK